MKLLIDGDPIVYRIGFASQKKQEDGSVKADPESHALHSCKKFIKTLLQETKAKEFSIYLSGKENFRYKVRQDYKANRKGTPKPVHYQAVRDYLESKWEAVVVNGIEADDALGLAQESNTVIATIDKDLLMVEGKHFNYGKREWATVTAEEGTRFFYKQMLTGDKVDNIIGLHGIGEKKSSKLLDSTPRSEWDKLIVDKYLEGFEEDGYHRAVQNSQLLWILQKGKDMPIEFT
tara:strand:- start:550 stop:1248 length:699 start_codon:yes stop_codon:yes gene_type:complete